MSIKIEIEETEAVMRRVRAEVPAKLVDKELDKAYRTLSRQVRIPGFRPGKVPRKVLEGRYGDAVVSDVEEALIERVFMQAIEEHGLHPVAVADRETEPIARGGDWNMALMVEVRPEANLTNLEGLKAERWQVDVTDDEVDEQLEHLAQRASTIEPVADGTAAGSGHLVEMNLVLTAPQYDEPLDLKEYMLEMDRPGQFDFLKGAVDGKGVGDTLEVADLEIPEGFYKKDWAGATVTASIEILAIKAFAAPALNDDFAKDQGHDDLAALRAEVRTEIEKHKSEAADRHQTDSLVQSLIDANPFEVGGGLIHRQAETILERYLSRTIPPGMERPHMHLHDLNEEEQALFRKEAETDIRRQLLLDAVANQQSIEIDDAAVETRLEEIAAEAGVELARFRAALGGQTDGIRIELREKAALDFLLGQADLVDAPWPTPEAEATPDQSGEGDTSDETTEKESE